MAKHIPTTILFVCGLANSAVAGELPYGMDAYVGAFGGWGGSRVWVSRDQELDQRVYPVATRKSYSPFYGGYAGIGWSVLAIEGGIFTLADYHAYAEGINPARKTTQTIRGTARFTRLLLRAPRDWSVQPYVFGGVAQVRSQSHEVGSCPTCGPGYVSDWRVDMKAVRPYVGAGVEIPLFGPVSGRVEYGYIPRASSSFWSGVRDYSLGSGALLVRF
jgi:hypothetical protein